MSLRERIEQMNGPIQTKGLNKTRQFVESPVVTKLLAEQVTKQIRGAALV